MGRAIVGLPADCIGQCTGAPNDYDTAQPMCGRRRKTAGRDVCCPGCRAVAREGQGGARQTPRRDQTRSALRTVPSSNVEQTSAFRVILNSEYESRQAAAVL